MRGALDGTYALVTGGGSGIGLGAAKLLVDDGCTVTLMGRTEAKVREAAEALGPGARWSAGSVDDEAAVERAVAVAAEGAGGLDVAVLAAGTGTAGPIIGHDTGEWQRTLETNLTGAFLCMKHAGAAMASSGGGAIVAVSSIAGLRTHRLMSAYCVSKAGLDALVENAADELGANGIRVNSVRPGLVPTDISVGFTTNEAIVADYLEQMPVGRLGTVDDVANLIRFLAGPESGWITGQCISVDGGHHLRRGPNIALGFGG